MSNTPNVVIVSAVIAVSGVIGISFLGRRCHSIGGLFRSLRLSVICCVVYCGQTVQDRPMVCIEVELECGVDISIDTIFDPLGPP